MKYHEPRKVIRMKSQMRLTVWLIILVLFLTSCDGGRHNMQDILKAYLAREMAGSDITFYYHIGDSFSGESDFQLRGDGSYEVWSTVTKERQRKNYSGHLDLSQVEALAQAMIAVQIWEVKHIRSKPGEDDPQAIIGVKTGQQNFQVVLWVSEISKSPPFVEVQKHILDLVHEVSNGEVLEIGQ